MELSKKEFDLMRTRRSPVDLNLLFTWLRDDGEIKIVSDDMFVRADAIEPESLDVNRVVVS